MASRYMSSTKVVANEKNEDEDDDGDEYEDEYYYIYPLSKTTKIIDVENYDRYLDSDRDKYHYRYNEFDDTSSSIFSDYSSFMSDIVSSEDDDIMNLYRKIKDYRLIIDILLDSNLLSKAKSFANRLNIPDANRYLYMRLYEIGSIRTTKTINVDVTDCIELSINNKAYTAAIDMLTNECSRVDLYRIWMIAMDKRLKNIICTLLTVCNIDMSKAMNMYDKSIYRRYVR